MTGIHSMVASATGQPYLALDETEATLLATGTVNVARHYDIGASQKTLDWIFLFQALGIVYGTRAVQYRQEIAKKAKSEKPNNVHPFTAAE